METTLELSKKCTAAEPKDPNEMNCKTDGQPCDFWLCGECMSYEENDLKGSDK